MAATEIHFKILQPKKPKGKGGYNSKGEICVKAAQRSTQTHSCVLEGKKLRELILNRNSSYSKMLMCQRT